MSESRRAEYEPVDHVSWRDVAGELVVLDMNSGEYHTFNDVGRLLWLAIADGQDMDAAVKSIHDEYQADEATIAVDVDNMVSRLLEKGLLRMTETQ